MPYLRRGIIWIPLCVLLVSLLYVWRASETRPAVTASREHSLASELSQTPSSAVRDEEPRAAHQRANRAEHAAAQHLARLDRPDEAERLRMQREREQYQSLLAKSERTALQEQMLQHVRAAARYPRSNRRFASPDLDPVLAARAPARRGAKSEDGSRLLSVWAGQPRYAVGDALHVYATVLGRPEQPGEPALPREASLTGTLAVEGGPVLAPLHFEPADEPGVYVARIDSRSVAGEPLSSGTYRVRVEAGEGLAQRLALALQEPSLSMTGAYRDRVRGGDLVVEAEVLVDRAGTFYARGSLYADPETPVGFAETTLPLERGTHWVPLRFHGRLLHDAGRPGPFVLAHLSVARRAFPVMHGVEVDPGHVTQPHPLSSFSAEPYNDLTADGSPL